MDTHENNSTKKLDALRRIRSKSVDPDSANSGVLVVTPEQLKLAAAANRESEPPEEVEQPQQAEKPEQSRGTLDLIDSDSGPWTEKELEFLHHPDLSVLVIDAPETVPPRVRERWYAMIDRRECDRVTMESSWLNGRRR